MKLSKNLRLSAVALSLSLAVAVTGCGSDRNAESPSGNGDTPSAGGATFGEMDSPCGEGDAKGATEQGVTDDAITIGYGDDRGFVQAPGLAQEVGDAMDAMVAWCNEQGGINGRQIKGNRYDAAIANTVQVIKEACATDFMLVGDGFANDFSGDPVRVGCELPHIPAYTVGGNSAMGELKVEPMPYPADRYNAGGLKAALQLMPELKESMTIIGTDSPATSMSNYKVGAALGTLGVAPKDCGITLHMAGESSYAPLAQKLKDCDVKAYFNAYTPSPQAFGLLQANQQAGLDLPLLVESQWYGDVGAQWNGETGAGDGLLAPLMVQPLENADVNKAVADYKAIVEGNKGKTGMLGEFAASAFLLWAQGAKECGSDLTRDCVMEKVASVEDWTAGGLQAPTNPGENQPSECVLMVELQGDKWTQVHPAERGTFDCDPSNVIDMDPATSGVALTKDRKFKSFLKQ